MPERQGFIARHRRALLAIAIACGGAAGAVYKAVSEARAERLVIAPIVSAAPLTTLDFLELRQEMRDFRQDLREDRQERGELARQVGELSGRISRLEGFSAAKKR